MEELAILGGPQAVTTDQAEATAWPEVSDDDLSAIGRVLKEPNYGCYDEGYRLEEEFAEVYRQPLCPGPCQWNSNHPRGAVCHRDRTR